MSRGLRVWCLLGAPLVVLGCTGSIGDEVGGNSGPGETGEPGKGPRPPVGPEGKPGAGALSDKDAVPGRASIRRLTRLEYDNTIRDLLGITGSLSKAAAFIPDSEASTSGFLRGGTITAGDDAKTMMTAGASVAEQVSGKLGSLLPCSPVPTAAPEQDTCVAKFITQFGKRAYRRPLTPRETELMQTLYRTQRSAEVGATF